MTYKETIYFVAKCLTISLDHNNRQKIEKQLKSTSMDWDTVVKVSTAHYVFPAIYCNLKRADFLKYLPVDLVDYMKYITGLNRDRNTQIIQQVYRLNRILLLNSIIPIFLKGAGNLLAGLYDDIAERMVGDIDFIFSKEDYPKAISVLKENGYSEVKKKEYYPPDDKKHYRRLQKENNIAAIEIHSEFSYNRKYNKKFNYSFVEKDSQVVNSIAVLSYANKLNLSIIGYQINDFGFNFKTIALRNAYDVFLLSKKTNAKQSVNTLDKLSHPLNCFLAACNEIFNNVASLEYNKTTKTALYLRDFISQINKSILPTSKPKLIKIFLFISFGIYLILKSIINRRYRFYLFKCLTDKNWYKEKLILLGIKKS
jgi:hypothetical protein